MAKHKRWSDKQKPDTLSVDEEINKTEQKVSIKKESTNIKSLVTSGTKYACVITATALLSGIFTPLTSGVELDEVIKGMLTIFIGLGGGVLIFLGTKFSKYSSIMILSGLGLMAGSLILIYEVIDKSLF
tara:strand:+ start:67 stop:453 length:387 start_codon:yes stop_codon:yes gene_type:complete